jgi:hypothetical protein
MTATPSRFSLLTTLCATALALGGCSSSDDASEPQASDLPEQREQPLLEAPEDGWLIESIGMNIAPGEDVEYCEVARLPGTPGQTYYVNRTQVAFNEYSHHLILFTVPPGSDAESEFEVGDIVPCNGAHQFGAVSALTGSQQAYQDVTYPEGVGRTVVGGQMVVINYHHLNTSNQAAWGRHAVALHLVDGSGIDHLARTFAFANTAFEIPPGTQRSFTSECTFDHDVQVWALTRHTHRWGTDFEVSFVGGDRGDDVFWKSEHYEADTNFRFRTELGLDSETLLMNAGEGFRFTCHYDNTTDETLRFGFGARDEMCILFGQWWEVTPGAGTPPQSCMISEVDETGFGVGQRIDAPGFD